MGSSAALKRRRVGRVAILELNRPQRHNAMDGPLVAAPMAALASLERDRRRP